MATPLPKALHAAYDWTDAAGEIDELAMLTGTDLDDYIRESAANAREHGHADVDQSDLRELASWLRRKRTMTNPTRRIALAGARSNPEPTAAPQPEANPRRRRRGRRGGRRRSRRNPTMMGTLTAVGLGALAIGGGYLAFKGWQRIRGQKKMPPGPVLASVLSPGATLADAPQVVADLRGPIQLATSGSEIPAGYTAVPTLRVLLENEDGTFTPREVKNVSLGATSGGVLDTAALSGRLPDGTIFNQRNELPGGITEPAVARLVTDVTGTFARDLYERMLNEIANKKVDWENGEAHDAAIKHVLGIVMPQVDYSRGLEPYTAGDAPSVAWNTAQLMGSVAQQSLLNKALVGS